MSATVALRGGLPGGEPLQHRPGLEDLDRLALVDEPDPGAAVSLVLDQALLLEPGQRGADRRAPDAERRGQIGLDEPLVGLQAPADDRVAQLVLGPRGPKIVDNLVDHAGNRMWPVKSPGRGPSRRREPSDLEQQRLAALRQPGQHLVERWRSARRGLEIRRAGQPSRSAMP